MIRGVPCLRCPKVIIRDFRKGVSKVIAISHPHEVVVSIVAIPIIIRRFFIIEETILSQDYKHEIKRLGTYIDC